MVVQGVGAATTLIVLMQLAIAGAMPLAAFAATAIAVVLGFILNLLNYQELLRPSIWHVWEEAVTIGGVTVLPQVCMHASTHSLFNLEVQILKKNLESSFICMMSMPAYYRW